MGFKEEFLQFRLSGLMVEELKEETYNHEACLSKAGVRKSSSYPENYKTCMNFFGVLRSLFQVLSGNENGPAEDEENPQQMSSSVQGNHLNLSLGNLVLHILSSRLI